MRVLVLAAAFLLLGPARALAFERQAGVSLGAGYAGVASDNPLPHHAFFVQAAGELGLDDTWSVRLLGGWAYHLGDEPLHRIAAGAEVVYLVDILELVPCLGIGLDVLGSVWMRTAGSEARADFAAHGVVGLDWLLSRQWTIGVEVRPYVSFTSLPSDPVWITALLRAQLLVEY